MTPALWLAVPLAALVLAGGAARLAQWRRNRRARSCTGECMDFTGLAQVARPAEPDEDDFFREVMAWPFPARFTDGTENERGAA